MSLLTAVLLVTLSFVSYSSGVSYQNGWDGNLHVECSDGYGLYRVRSEHHNGHEDRRWRWDCRRAHTGSHYGCSWHGNINNYDSEILFHCPENKFMTGVSSVHHNGHEDRVWRVRCCGIANTCTKSCYLTPYLNGFDQYIDRTASPGKVFTGMFSFHSNHHEDRRWKMMECRVGSC